MKVGDLYPTKRSGDVLVVEYINCHKVLIEFLNTGERVYRCSKQIRKGAVKDKTSCPTSRRWGINDADYPVILRETINGKKTIVWTCPIYMDWYQMLNRCIRLSSKEPKNYERYKDVSVCEEWKYFSNFRRWVLEEQPNKDWQNCDLDKDILFAGNKVYSPETCVYVPSRVNCFVRRSTSKLLCGVTYCKRDARYYCQLNNLEGDKVYVSGNFQTEMECHKAWQAKKHEYACQLADLQDDPRVAKALRERYAPDKDWTKV